MSEHDGHEDGSRSVAHPQRDTTAGAATSSGSRSGAAPGQRTLTSRLPARRLPAAAATTAAPRPAANSEPARGGTSTGARLIAEPARVAMPPSRAGATSARSISLTNRGTDPVDISDVVSQRNDSVFRSTGIDDPLVAPGASTRVRLEFRPLAAITYRDTLVVDTYDGPDRGIPIIGRGKAMLSDAIAAHEPGAAEERETAEREDDGARARAAAHRSSAPSVRTYTELEAAFTQALDFEAAGHREEALVLATAVAERMRELTHPQHVSDVLKRLGVGSHAAHRTLSMAHDATVDVRRRITGRWTIARGPALAAFQQSRRTLLLMTGESDDAGDLRAFDQASLVTAAAAAAPLVVAGTIVTGGALLQAAPAVSATIGALGVGARETFFRISNWINAHPEEALAWTEFATGAGLNAAEDPQRFWADLQTPEGWWQIATDLFFTVMPARAGRGGRAHDGDAPPAGGARPGAAGPDDAPATQGAATADAPLPPVARQQATAPDAATTARAQRAAEDTLDRLRAFVAAARTRADAVMVPKARSTAARDGTDLPTSRADDATPVADRGTTLGERYDHQLHGRQVGRARQRGALHDAGRGESALAVKNLRARGGRIVERRDDPLLGDVLVTVELPSRQRVTVRERGVAPPRRTRAADPRRARQLQREAGAARAATADRDQRLAAHHQATVQVDAQGHEHVLVRAEHIIIGGGPAAVMDAATLPGAGKVVGADGAEQLNTRVFGISTETHGSWQGREGKTGQPPGEYADLPTTPRPVDLVDEPTDYMPVGPFADTFDLTADAAGFATARGWTVQSIDSVPDPTWKVPGAARRLTAVDAGGRVRYYYADKIDVTGGLGPARKLEPTKFDATDPAQGATTRDELERAGVIVSAEAHLAGAPAAARILISGGGATAPWNAKLATQRNAKAQIDWISTRASNKAAVTERRQVEAELTRLQAEQHELERQLFEVNSRLDWAHRTDERAALEAKAGALTEQVGYLTERQTQLQFGDAMINRNLSVDDAFGMGNVRLASKAIVSIEPAPATDGGPPRARVTFSDGSSDVYDQVIVNHGSDPSAPGGSLALLQQEKMKVQRTGTRAHLASADGAVRVFGAAADAARSTVKPTDPKAPDPYRDKTDFVRQPAHSAGVPSFHLTGAQIREANETPP